MLTKIYILSIKIYFWMDGGMDRNGKTATEVRRDGHGTWTGWSWKVDGKRSKTKDLLYTIFVIFDIDPT